MYVVTEIGAPLSSDVSAVRTYTLPTGANAFWVQAITQNVRIQLGANVPTASVGGQIKAGDPIRLLRIGGSFKALQESATAYFYVQPVKVSWIEP